MSLGEESSWQSGGLYRNSYSPHKPTTMPPLLRMFQVLCNLGVPGKQISKNSGHTCASLTLMLRQRSSILCLLSSTRKTMNSSKLINTRMSEYALSPEGEVEGSQILQILSERIILQPLDTNKEITGKTMPCSSLKYMIG